MIEVERLSKTYGTTPAIEDVTFSVERGEILGFLGPNGAGKTTTMRILAGYLPATSGTARIAGFDVHEESMAVRQRIGYLPEIPPLYPDMTVEGFLHFVARIKGVSAGDRPARVRWSLERCNVWDRRKIAIRKLSKGYRQRVGIAQAIVHDPPAIILDEPTVGLDPRQIIEVRNLIKSLAGDHTIVLSTHILPEVSMTCTRVAIVNRGRIAATGHPETLMDRLVGELGYELEVEADAPLAVLELPPTPAIAPPVPEDAESGDPSDSDSDSQSESDSQSDSESEEVPQSEAPDSGEIPDSLESGESGESPDSGESPAANESGESGESPESQESGEPGETPESDSGEAIAIGSPPKPDPVVVLVDRAVAAIARLQDLPGVKSVEPELDAAYLRQHPNRLRLYVRADRGAEPGRDLAAAALGLGLGLCEMRRSRASLEDVFLELTTEDAASEAASNANANTNTNTNTNYDADSELASGPPRR